MIHSTSFSPVFLFIPCLVLFLFLIAHLNIFDLNNLLISINLVSFSSRFQLVLNLIAIVI